MATWQQTYNRLKKKKELLDNTNNTLEISKTILGSNIAPIKTTNTFNSTSNITSTLKPTIDFAPFGTKQGIASVGEEIENKIKTPTEVLKEEKKKSVFSQTTDDDDSYIKKAESKVIKDYASMSKEELKKEEENILKKQNELSKTKDYRKKNREWWDKDDGIIRNLGNVVYKSVLEKDPYDYSDEYNELTARYNAIQKVKQGNYVENKEYDKGLSGALEKSTDTFMGGMMSSLRGLEGTTKKILGNEENISEKTMIEKLGDKAYQETDSGLGKFGLDISRGIGQQAPMLFASGVGAGAKLTTALAGTSFGGMAYNQAKEEGFTEEQATKYGVGVGVLETMLNKILPSYNINGKNVFGKTATDKLTSKMMSKVAGNEFLKRTLTSGAGEFTEEYLQEFLDPIMRETLLEEDNDVGIKDAEGIKDLAKNIASYTAQNFFSKENAYAGLLGFVTSSTLGAQSNIDAHRAVKGAQQQAVADAETELGRKLTKEEEQQINLEVQNAFNDGQLQQNYQEEAKKRETYQTDITKYDEKQRKTIQGAIESGILNNTRKTHEFVDMVAKISADKGVDFNFANNEKLKQSGFVVEGKNVDGFVDKNGITLNIDSNNALNKVVGHEITHILEGTDLYTDLQTAVKDYATTKGVWDTKLAELTDRYKNVEGANVENELTSDLVGEYLFTDKDFVNNLSTTKPNVFKKVYNEIKYLLKVATAGSKEARQLEKVKKTFEDAYKNSGTKLTNDSKYSVSEAPIKDNQGRELTKEQQEYFKESKVRDENGNLITLYRGTQEKLGNIFNYLEKNLMLGKNKPNEFGFFFTDSKLNAERYARKRNDITGEYEVQDLKEVYLDSKNPLDFRELGRATTKKDFAKFLEEKGIKVNKDILKSGNLNVWERFDKNGEVLRKSIQNAGYDGIIFDEAGGNSYVVFNSNQIKNVDNTNPTADPDIRYSISDNISPQEKIDNLEEQKENAFNLINDITKQGKSMIKANIGDNIRDAYYFLGRNDAFANEYKKDHNVDENTYLPEDENFKEYAKKYLDPIYAEPDLTTEEMIELAEDNYSYTDNFETGAYMLPNGKLLDFDDGGGYRDDHRTIGMGYTMQSFIDAGNIRMKPESNGAEFTVEPTSEQYETLRNFFDNADGEVYIDIDKAGTNNYDSAEYNSRTPSSKIINDIKEYYRTGSFPKKSEFADFRYSLSKADEIAPREAGNTYSEDVKLEEAIAPIKKELEKVTKQLNETIKEVKKVAKDTKELTKDLKPLKNLEEDINPFVEMFRNETKSNIEDIAKDVEYVADNWKNLKKSNEQGIENNDPYQAFVDNQLTKKVDSKAQTKINKPKVKDNILERAFTNINADIDRFSDETGNKMIKIYGDQVNNSFGEIIANINKNQTDNNGKSIGKGIKPIFKQAKDKGLNEAFNDYLFQLSNVARHKQGKGSLVPEVESARLILEYETEYPEMKKWANEVNKYNRNNLYKQVDAGLITKDLADKITNMYDFYVPFMEDIQRNYVNQETYEIKPRSTVKFARGGADKNLLPFEEAMIKQTQSTISTIRKNQLYQEIIKSSKEKTDIGADLRDNINDLSDSLYVDENGYYLTGYVNGERQSVKIDEGLYKSLKNEMGEKTKYLEAKFSKTAKVLQTTSNIRRNMLTTWNPFFLITNTVKDAQDSPLNSKYAKDWAVNYPKALKEITMGKGEHLDEFLNLYGNTGVMGDYNVDSGVSDITKTAKNKTTNNAKKFLTPAGLNEISELTPRYAEYLASIKNGVSPMEAIYNAREVTVNFGRGGWLTKFLNRNGFTFLNASVQGFSKLGRNFTDNGVKGAVQMSAKAVALGMAPALLNALMFGLGDDEDEDYKVLPDYVKDNYYLFKTDDGDFIRIPKGRMISIFGSASRRALELANGEKDAFDGYLKNTYSQVGVSNPMESNILAPILQATDGESGKTWYGEDLVPSRLQKKPAEQQYDESIDKLSIWAGQKLGISPYKLNYVLDQYSGGIGDMIIPTITDEAQSENDSVLGIALAPFKDKFTADSTTDNKNVGDFYSKSEELEKKSNSDYATDEDKLISSYMYSVSGEMSELYKERREVQNDDSLTKSEKYRKSQAIKDEINALAKEGLEGYKNVDKSSNYAEVGGRGFYKYVDDKTGQTRWGRPKEDEMDELNSMGLTTNEKSTYYGVKNEIGEVYDKYKDTDDYDNKKKDIVNTISNASLNDDTKYYLYDKYYGSTEELEAIKMVGIGADDYFKYASNTFKADKDENGKSISGSKKTKVFDYINSMDIGFEQKAILAKLEYNTYDEWNNEIIDYLNNDDNITYEEMEKILKQLGFEIDSSGVISW